MVGLSSGRNNVCSDVQIRIILIEAVKIARQDMLGVGAIEYCHNILVVSQ